MAPEVLEYVASYPIVWSRDYKQFICGKGKKGIPAFIQSFVDSFVEKYFKN
jgi:hypothetical protein